VRVLEVGLCGTDREINEGLYGATPPGSDVLVLGHENFGVVEETAPAATTVAPGDHVVAMVRRPGRSLYDRLGMPDLTTDDVYHERGISLLHGFLSEWYVDDEAFLVRVPRALRHVGVLLEPLSVVEKGLAHGFDLQRRLPVWRPQRAVVLGAGPVGLLATMALRLRGLEVVTLALPEPPYLNAELVDGLGAAYVSVRRATLRDTAKRCGPLDLIFEATGYSPLVFEAMEVLGKNGVLVVSGLSGGGREVAVRADAINMGFVLGNKAMVGTVNAGREHFELGLRDMATCEIQYPGWLTRLITHRVQGLDDHRPILKLFEASEGEARPIKVVVEVAPA
jgi:threonine dehydrogenase-like Zn-dependent dehydrogenase